MEGRSAGAAPAGAASAAYGGPGWSPRRAPHRAEIGTLWGEGAVDSEWRPLRRVLLRAPGPEIEVAEADAAQYLARPDPARAREEHAMLAEAYRAEGVEVLAVPDVASPTPNRMFCADLFVATPEGAILARPASTVRAGEEVAVAQALAAARVPIVTTLTGGAVFEGADLMWLDPATALIGRGLRTNEAAIRQIAARLAEIGVETVAVDMPAGTMHLMGMLRILDRDLAVAWPRRTPHAAVEALRARGVAVAFLPDEDEAQANRGLNAVTLGPRRILMPGGNPAMRRFYEGLGVAVAETPMDELRKCAGAVGCLTGIVARERAPA
jgi:N-dimethylarginine dimethylaminohydrolase